MAVTKVDEDKEKRCQFTFLGMVQAAMAPQVLPKGT